MTEVEFDDSYELQSDGTNAVHSPDPFGPAVAKRFKVGSGGSGTQSYKSRVAASTAAMSESINELIQTVKTSEHRVVTHDAGRDLHIEAIKSCRPSPFSKMRTTTKFRNCIGGQSGCLKRPARLMLSLDLIRM